MRPSVSFSLSLSLLFALLGFVRLFYEARRRRNSLLSLLAQGRLPLVSRSPGSAEGYRGEGRRKLEEGRELSSKIFQALQLYGMARIDLFLTKDKQKFYLNDTLKLLAGDNCEVVVKSGPTAGAACSALLAIDLAKNGK